MAVIMAAILDDVLTPSSAITHNISLFPKSHDRLSIRCKIFLNYYATALSRVQITPKTGTIISRYLYYRKPV